MQSADEDADESQSESFTSSGHTLFQDGIRTARSSSSNASELCIEYERQLLQTNNFTRHDNKLFQHGATSSSDTRESDSEHERQLIPASLPKPVPLLTRAGQCKGHMYDKIMGRLEILHDNGQWHDFDNLSNFMLNSFNLGKKDINCIIVLERGMAAYYQNDFEKSREFMNNALKLVNDTDNSVMLQGRAYYMLANVSLHEKKLGKALEYLQLSEQLLCMHDNEEDKAELYYTYGNFRLECISMTANPSRLSFREAKEYFVKEYQLAVTCQDERVKRKKMRYALLKIAHLLLDCRNESGRKRTVAMEDVEEAEACLDKIELELWDNITFGIKLSFYLARSDQFYRSGNYVRALEFAELAWSMVHERGFKKQANKAKARISHLKQFIRSDFITEIPVEEFVTRINEMTDESGHSADLDSDTTDNETQTRHDTSQEL